MGGNFRDGRECKGCIYGREKDNEADAMQE